jgi:hypothetical protein
MRTRLRLFAAALVGLAFPVTAAAQLYEGNAGSAPIIVELDTGDGAPNGRYFYRSIRLDIALDGEREADVLKLSARLTGDSLVLKRAGNGWAGNADHCQGQDASHLAHAGRASRRTGQRSRESRRL